MRKYVLLAVAVSFAVLASSSQAAQTSANFQARITIQTSCVVAVGNLDFGNVGVIVGGEAATSTVSVNCSNGTPYTLSFAASSAVTSYSSTMINGAEDVAYGAALSGAGGTGNGGLQTYTIDGVLPAQTTPTPAIYTDNQTVFLNY